MKKTNQADVQILRKSRESKLPVSAAVRYVSRTDNKKTAPRKSVMQWKSY
jgi:hypothetical protein